MKRLTQHGRNKVAILAAAQRLAADGHRNVASALIKAATSQPSPMRSKVMGVEPPVEYDAPTAKAIPEPAGPRRQQAPAMTPKQTTQDAIDYVLSLAFPGMSAGAIAALPKAERDARSAAAQQATEDAVHQQLEQGGAAAAKAFLDGLATFGVLQTSHDPVTLGDVTRVGASIKNEADRATFRARAGVQPPRRIGPHRNAQGHLVIGACTPAEWRANKARAAR